MRIRGIRKLIKVIAAIVIAALALGAIGMACVPSILRSIDNGKERQCFENSYRLLNKLEEKLMGDEDNTEWYRLIEEKNSSKLLSALKKEVGIADMDISDNYVKFGENQIAILCKKHVNHQDIAISIPNNIVQNAEIEDPPQSDVITWISAYGRDTYFQNTILDRDNPHQYVFTNADDTNRIFSAIKVRAYYAGGGSRDLNENEYKIKVGSLDMRKVGSYSFRIEYVGRSITGDLFTTFDVDVIENNIRQELVLNCDDFGIYRLASWAWTDYVADALDAPGNYMDFDASIVYDEGVFYYLPDGFRIKKDNKLNTSLDGAMDLDDNMLSAYRIAFDLKTPVYHKDRATMLAHTGSLKFEDGNFYIWQDVDSKSGPKGWLRVYCELTRLDE
ncbi:MAG: hypothetical protein IJT23_03255 [Clostridia bacterium]|nr:hypothetical protein [Clostridia bacterium]